MRKIKVNCSQCNKFIGETHHCYDNNSSEIHSLDNKRVCHECWDNEIRKAVECAESNFL